MGATKKWTSAHWGVLLLATGAIVTAMLLHDSRPVRADQSSTPTVREIHLGQVRPDALYALTVSVKNPAQVQGNDSVLVTVTDAQGEIESKWLHTADLDFYLTVQPRAAGPLDVSLSAPAGVHLPEIGATVHAVPQVAAVVPAHSSEAQPGLISASPNGTWQTAQSFNLGQTIYGSDDERPYAPSPARMGTRPC